MALPGTAFLALWNDRAQAREDYEAWHTREHIPERLGVPGILAGQRYVDGEGPLPSYFTLYPLVDLDVLKSDEYRAVVNRPTAWSQSMRPALSRMKRRGCTTALSLGAGIGGCLAAVLLGGEGKTADAFTAVADSPAFCALHLGRVAQIAALPFESPVPSDLPAAEAVLLVEGYDWAPFSASLDGLDGLIEAAGYHRLLAWTRYRLAYAIEHGAAAAALPVHADLIRRTAGITAR